MGELCGSFSNKGVFTGDCQKCQVLLNKDLSSGPKCYKVSDAPPAWKDARQWFAHMKGCGCNGAASGLIMGAASLIVAASLF